MNPECERFDAWLDDGLNEANAVAARAHASGCARCAAALELESLLAAAPVADAGSAFTERVLFRVRDGERARAASRLVLAGGDSPWWLRAPAEPSAALALVVAALLAWRGDGVWAFATALATRVRAHDWLRGPGSGALYAIGHAVSGNGLDPLTSAMLLAVMLPVVGVASWWLYRAFERVVDEAVSRRPRALPRAAVRHPVAALHL